MSLSDLMVRQARAVDVRYTLADGDGLGLVVMPTGGKSWHLRYYWLGKQKRMSLGNYPQVSLREARVRRDEARALLAKNINPCLDRQQKRRALELADGYTFKAVFDAWVMHRRKELKEGRQSALSQILRNFDNDILPSLGKMSIYDIRRPQLLGVLARIEARKAFTTAEKVRTWLRQLFRYALVVVEGLEINPASDLDVVAEPKPPVCHNPFLRMAELPAFLQKLRDYRGMLTTQLGIRLLFLTGVRTGELRLATPDQFDLERGLWVIPPEVVKQLQLEMRKKGKRQQDMPPYLVPLSVQAQEIVRYLLAQVRPAQRYLLAHRSDLKKRISENTLNSALKRMGYEAQLTGHGIRATISTALNEMGYPKNWVDAQLSHADPNKVSATYNHAMYVEPRRKMMQDWADRLDLLEQGQVGAASAHLTIRIDGMPVVDEGHRSTETTTADALSGISDIQAQRLSALPTKPQIVTQIPVSDVQRERLAMVQAYEAPHNLPVVQFAKLVGKSKDQINREIKAGKLLTISLGNRGQRVPDWQLEPIKQSLIQAVLKQVPQETDGWKLYHALQQPYDALGRRPAIEAVCQKSVSLAAQLVAAQCAAA